MTGVARRVLDYNVPALVADDHRGCAILIALRSEVIARMVDGRFPGATPKDGVYLRVIFVERDRISHGVKAPGHDWRRRRGAVHEYDAMTWDLFPKDLLCLHLGKAQIAECPLYHPSREGFCISPFGTWVVPRQL